MYRAWNRQILDPDTIAYITGRITNQREILAANALIIGLKQKNIWSTRDRIHLISPTSFAASIVCAKTRNNMLTSVSTDPTFSSNGHSYDGTSMVLKSDLMGDVAGINMTITNSNICIYNRTATALLKNKTYVGGGNNTTTAIANIGSAASSLLFYSWTSAIQLTPAAASGQGFLSLSRESAGSLKCYVNGVNTASVSTLETATAYSQNLYVGARNNNGTADQFSAINCAFFSSGSSLTPTQEADFYTLVQQYETDVIVGGRQV